MARGKTLEYILNSVRAEARLSLLPAHNTQVRDSHVILIQREYDRLWGDFNWPHLRVRHTFALEAGQRTYAVPDGMSIDRVEIILVKDGSVWRKLVPGIPEEAFSVHDSELDERSWPARRWQATDEDEIEIWPIPDQSGDPTTLDGYLKVIGIRDLRPLVADNDVADLDDRLLTLYAAGTILAATGAKDAQLKIEAANRLYTRLKGRQIKASRFNMFGTTARQPAGGRRMVVESVGSSPLAGYSYLTDEDGALLVDEDGDYLAESS